MPHVLSVMTDFLLNGARLHVAAPTGDGDPMILVHGGWTDHRTWSMLVPLLAQRNRVISYDRRGHSLSDYGPGPSPRRRDEDDLAALIDELGAARVHLVGSSYGASIALGLAGRRPELVRSVVAHEPPLTGLCPQPAVEAQFASVQDQIEAGDVEGGTRRFFEEVILGPGGWELVPEHVREASIANAQTFVDLREDPFASELDVEAVQRFPGPITITRGEISPAWLQETATATAERLRRPLRVISGAGHSPHLTTPQTFAAAIAEAVDGPPLHAAA
jgi:pimeloyl-ACP methyl ester carboxylesterase